jgi:hypothetical protein
MIDVIFKQKQKRYSERIYIVLRKFLNKTPAADRPYIERYIDAVKVMGVDDPGRLCAGTRCLIGTKRQAFFCLLSRLIMSWWDWNKNPGKESEFLAILKDVEGVSDKYYLQCGLKGDVKNGFYLEVFKNENR